MSTKNRGFTLLEMAISVGIIAIMGSVIAQIFFVTTKSNTKVEIEKDVKQNGDYAVAVMSRMIRTAQDVTSTCSDSGTSAASITILNPDNGITTFSCDETTGVARIASSSAAETVYLTNTTVALGRSCSLSHLTFICTSVSGIANHVDLSFDLTQQNVSPDQTQQSSLSFQTSVTLRR